MEESINGLQAIFCLLGPEAGGDILHAHSFNPFIKALVGGATLQCTEMRYIGPYLDIIELMTTCFGMHAQPTAIPPHLVLRMMLMEVIGQDAEVSRLGISAHEAYTGNVFPELTHKAFEFFCRQRCPYIFPEIFTMTSRTMAWTPTDIDGQGYFIRNLLKHDARINVLEHSISYSPPPVVPERSC